MFRTALLRSARAATCQTVRRAGPIARPVAANPFLKKSQFAPAAFQAARCYSAAAGLQKNEVEGRIVDLLKNFDKVSFIYGVKDLVLMSLKGYRPYQGTIFMRTIFDACH